jgi:hypothetical protein
MHLCTTANLGHLDLDVDPYVLFCYMRIPILSLLFEYIFLQTNEEHLVVRKNGFLKRIEHH